MATHKAFLHTHGRPIGVSGCVHVLPPNASVTPQSINPLLHVSDNCLVLLLSRSILSLQITVSVLSHYVDTVKMTLMTMTGWSRQSRKFTNTVRKSISTFVLVLQTARHISCEHSTTYLPLVALHSLMRLR